MLDAIDVAVKVGEKTSLKKVLVLSSPKRPSISFNYLIGSKRHSPATKPINSVATYFWRKFRHVLVYKVYTCICTHHCKKGNFPTSGDQVGSSTASESLTGNQGKHAPRRKLRPPSSHSERSGRNFGGLPGLCNQLLYAKKSEHKNIQHKMWAKTSKFTKLEILVKDFTSVIR